MSARVTVLVLAAILTAPVALAAVDPNETTYEMASTVNGIAVAETGGRFAGISDDPSTTGFGAQAIVYQMWAPGGNTPFFGPADPEECDGTIGGTTCDNDALVVATTADGTRMAVATYVNSDRGALLLLINANGRHPIGEKADGSEAVTRIDGVPVGVAMSDDGTRVALATNVGTPANSGRVYLFDWGGAPSLVQNPYVFDSPNEPINDIDITGDGTTVVVGANKHSRLRTVSTDTSIYRDSGYFDSPVNAVDAADEHVDHWSIAGYGAGSVTLHSDASNKQNHHEAALKVTSDSVESVALRDDASAFAFGSDAGAFWVYTLNPADATFSLIKRVTGLPGSVTSLDFTPDGRSLAVATSGGSDGRVALYDVGSDVKLAWNFDAASPLGQVAVDEGAENVISAFGDEVYRFAALHDVRAVLNGLNPSLRPGEDKNITIDYRNAGNRYETVSVTPEAPAGWQASVGSGAFRLAPDAQRGVPLSIKVPANAAPGPYTIVLNHTDGSGEATAAELPVTIPTVKRWSLAPVTGTSLAIENGAPAAFVLAVTNQGNTRDSTDIQITGLPRGWTATTEPSTVTLSAGETKEVTINVDAPDGAAQLAQATIRASLTKDATKAVSLTATVGARFGVSLDVPSSVPIEPGASTTFTATVTNAGNTLDSYVVELGNLPTGWRAAFQNGLTTLNIQSLGAGDSRDIPVSLQAPLAVQAPTQVQLQVSISSLGDTTERTSRGLLISVQDVDEPEDPIPGVPLLAVMAMLAVLVARRRR